MSYSVKRYVPNERSVNTSKDVPKVSAYQGNYEIARPMRTAYKQETQYNKPIDLNAYPPLPSLKKNSDHSMNELKAEMQNLKVEVNRFVGKNPASISSSVTAKHLNCEDTTIFSKTASNLRIFDQTNLENSLHQTHSSTDLYKSFENDDSDKESVTSQKIFQPLKRLQRMNSSENYDHDYYLQLEVQVLTNELKNLKTKYLNKKKEMSEQIEMLEKKNNYLQTSLQKSETSLRDCQAMLEREFVVMKSQLLKKKSDQEEVPTKDKVSDHQEAENQIFGKKIKQLYEQIATKTKKISELKGELESINEAEKNKSHILKKQQEKNIELQKKIEFIKLQYSRKQQHFEMEMNKKKELQSVYDITKAKYNELSRQYNSMEQRLNQIESQNKQNHEEGAIYRQKEQKMQAQLYDFRENNKRLKQMEVAQEQEIKYLKETQEEYFTKIEQLNRRIKDSNAKMSEMQMHYQNIIEEQRRTNQQKLQELRADLEAKTLDQISYLQPKSKSFNNGEKQRDTSAQMLELERQNRRWKTEYKVLKRKHEEVVWLQNSCRNEAMGHYKGFVEFKQKYEILQKKCSILEESCKRYAEVIRNKENQSTRKQIQSLIIKNDCNKDVSKYKRECENVKYDIKRLNEAISEDRISFQKQSAYRQQIERKLSQINPSDSDLKEIIQKVNRRLEQQDEKMNKYLKESKKKDALVNQLKEQVREIMENNQAQINERKNAEIAQFVTAFTNKKQDSIELMQSQMMKEKQIFEAQNLSFMSSNIALKDEIGQLKTEIFRLKQESKSLTHLYNQKCRHHSELQVQINLQLQEKDLMIEELKEMKFKLQNLFSQEMMIRKEQIQLLRSEVLNFNRQSFRIDTHNFDEALRNQIELSKGLRDDLAKKNEELFRLRDSLAALKTQFDNMKSEIEVIRLKSISEKKNIEVNCQIEIQNINNRLSMEEKKVASLDQKIKQVIDENKKKDSFIQTYIMGKKLPAESQQFVKEFIKQYEITLNGKEIMDKLQNESHQLQKLSQHNFNLIKEIAALKEKLLSYQMEEGEQVSLYESREYSQSKNSSLQSPIGSILSPNPDSQRKASPGSFEKRMARF